MPRFVLAALACAALASGAAAQSRGTPVCKDAPMPFAATEANRLSAAALQQAVSGKTLVYVRESIRTPGTWIKGEREHRGDGSMIYTCAVARSAEGPWRPCTSFGPAERQVAGGRDVGIWSVKNGALCSAKAAFGERSEDCFAIHRQGGVLAARRVSGPLAACVQGTVTLQ
ncbi:MAG: hypothetical protein JNM29_06175 [Candidatus Odyssella sp.]|nr:hypothetical protein [Candidatus Odyssella sp.]